LSFKPFKLLVGDPYTQPCISGCRRWLPKWISGDFISAWDVRVMRGTYILGKNIG
jgi:hypothetical protein